MRGAKIKALREEQLLERKELANKVGCKYSTIYKVETTDHMPRLSTARKIAQALDVPADEILDRETTAAA